MCQTITFKELCETCYESGNCKECTLRNSCSAKFKNFLQKHIIKIEDEIDVISASTESIDKGYASPCDFINENTGDFMLSKDIGDLKLESK